jgi:hypothetical protein
MYYLLETNYFAKPEPYRTDATDPPSAYEPAKWLRGRSMKPPADTLQFVLEGRRGSGLAELFLDSTPLFRTDLLAALREAGVDNIEAFAAELHPSSGQPVSGYQAVNILGLVKCADMSKSEFDDVGGTGLIAVSFRKLVIDESAAKGMLFFRLAESVASIIVHENVKDRLDTKSFKYLSWTELTE